MKSELLERITFLCTDTHPLHLEGWTTPEKALAMCEVIEREKPVCVVEIGVFGGRSAIPMAIAVRENERGCVYAIDPWEIEPVLEGNPSQADQDWWRNNVNLHTIHNGFIDAIRREGLQDWLITLRCTSQMASHLFPWIDMLHIDGNHTEVASCRDVELYLPKVKKNGLIWFDDVDWETTRKAVSMLDAKCERVIQVGTCVLFKKGKKMVQKIKDKINEAAPEVVEAIKEVAAL